MPLVSYFVSYNFAKVMKIIKNKEKREENVEKDDKNEYLCIHKTNKVKESWAKPTT